MMIMGQNDGVIFDLSNVTLRLRNGGGGCWLDANSHTVARFETKERAGAVMRDLWEAAKSGADFYEIPGA